MKTVLKKIVLMVLSLMLLFGMAACGGGSGNGDDNNPGGNTSAEKSGTVTVSIPANASTQYAWEAMEYAYESLPGNEKVDVKIETNTSSEDYTTKLLQSLTAGAQNVSADIVVANEAGQYLKTCFADYMPYLCNLDYVLFGILGAPMSREHTCMEPDGICDFKLKADAEPMPYWPPVFAQGKGYK